MKAAYLVMVNGNCNALEHLNHPLDCPIDFETLTLKASGIHLKSWVFFMTKCGAGKLACFMSVPHVGKSSGKGRISRMFWSSLLMFWMDLMGKITNQVERCTIHNARRSSKCYIYILLAMTSLCSGSIFTADYTS